MFGSMSSVMSLDVFSDSLNSEFFGRRGGVKAKPNWRRGVHLVFEIIYMRVGASYYSARELFYLLVNHKASLCEERCIII